jgi:uncharacterized repeat protein (TIGR01451 family)/LPXTG-motif cell wall-anchored protein
MKYKHKFFSRPKRKLAMTIAAIKEQFVRHSRAFTALFFVAATGSTLALSGGLVFAASSGSKTGSVSGGAAGQAGPGQTINWVVNYNHSGSLGTMTLTDPIPAGTQFVSGSLVTPPGYDKQYSQNGGTSYGSADPGAATTNIKSEGVAPATQTAVTQGVAAPPASFNGAQGAGDGLEALFWQDKIYNFNHHTNQTNTGTNVQNAQIQCHIKSSGAVCPSPFSGVNYPTFASGNNGDNFGTGASDISFPVNNQAGINQATGRVVIPAAQNSATSGVLCVELSTNKSCGYTVLENKVIGTGNTSVFAGGAMVGTKYYLIDMQNNLYCVDTTTTPVTQCGAPYPIHIDPAQTTDGSTGFPSVYGSNNRVEVFGKYIFTSFNKGGGFSIGCVDSTTNAICSGYPVATGSGSIGGVLTPVMDTSGNVTGVCAGKSPNGFSCYSLTGGAVADPYPPAPASYQNLGHPTQFGSEVVIGTKVYIAYEGSSNSTYTCFDFATSAPCSGYTAPISTGNVLPYTLRQDPYFPTCIWEVGDAGIFDVFGADTGAPTCVDAKASVSAQPTAFYCDGGTGHVQNWSTLKLSNITNSQYTDAHLTIKDQNGNVVAPFNDYLLSPAEESSGTVDISAIPITGATAKLTAEVSLSGANTTAWGAGHDPYVQLAWAGDDIQFCFQTTVSPCTIGAAGITNTATTNTVDDGGSDVKIFQAPTLNYPSACTKPTSEKAFSQTSTSPGGAVKLTFTVKNTSGMPTAGTWSLKDNLPAGMVVANPKNVDAHCHNGAINAASGDTAITLTGDFTTTTAQCTMSIDVTSASAGQYQNCPTNIDPVTDIDKPTQCATVQFNSTPTIATQIAGDGYSDTVTIGNTGGASGTLTWKLYGPVAPGSGGSCTAANWAGAPVYQTASMPTVGDVTVTTTPTTKPTAPGCYSYADDLTGSGFAAPATSAVGQASETFVIQPGPTVTTTIHSNGYADSIVISGTGGFNGSYTWTLYGPVNAGSDGTCATASWAGAPTVGTGTIPVSGDNTYTATPTADPSAQGCYSYAGSLSGPNFATVNSAVGQASETFVRKASPTVATIINADGYSDDVTVANTAGFSGSYVWTLRGPVNAGPSGTCSDATWTGAASAANGTVVVPGNGVVNAKPTAKPTAGGCYSYEGQLQGANYATNVDSVVGQASETFSVQPGPAVATTISNDGFSDTVNVTGSSGFDGSYAWTLYGPVNPGPDGTCATATWAGAPTAGNGTIPTHGDGAYTATPSANPTAVGCYSYAGALSSTHFATVDSAVGQASETFVRKATPTISTTISGDKYSDVITIAGTHGFPGSYAWTLYGPVAPGAGGDCGTANWNGAPTYTTGTVQITGDLTVTQTPSTKPTAAGCYSYAGALTGTNYSGTIDSAVGQASETFAAQSSAAITTAINQNGYADDVTIAGTNGFSGTLTWKLNGPVNAGQSGTCTDANWTNAPQFDTGTQGIPGDGTYTVTPTSNPSAAGCYSYSMSLSGPNYPTATSAVGIPSETFARASTPTIATVVNSNGYADDITIANTSGFSGSYAWTLYGPVNAGSDGTCGTATWTGAPSAANGTVAIGGNGTATATPSSKPTAAGCYSYAGALTGTNYSGTINSAVGQTSETFAVQPGPTVSTTINSNGYADDIVVSGTSGFSGSYTWTLYGPVSAGASGTCADANWTGAPTVGTGTLQFAGDGTHTAIPSADPTAQGCYSYAGSLTSSHYPTVNSVVGQASETYLRKAAPTVATVINSNKYADDITIANTSGFSGSYAWTLYGPVDAGSDGTCGTANWTGAPSFTNGTVQITGNITVTATPATKPTAPGCYSYAGTLSGSNYKADVLSAVGQPSETFAVAPAPTITTQIDSDTYSDNITVAGTNGFGGTINWTLYGPVKAGASGTCSDADWTNAPAFATGSTAATGNGSHKVTPTSNPAIGGCYSYGMTMSGPNYADVRSQPGIPSETFARKVRVNEDQLKLATTAEVTIKGEPPVASIVDHIVVTNTQHFAGTLTWKLLGPVDPKKTGAKDPVTGQPVVTCDGVSWTGVKTADTGTVSIVGDGTFDTAKTDNISTVGCYGYEVTLSGDQLNTVKSFATDVNESVENPRTTPAFTTTASKRVVTDNVYLKDTVKVTGSKALGGTIEWTLHGPLKPNADNICAPEGDKAWDDTPIAAKDTMTFVGDGAYPTPETAVKEGGCYTFSTVITGPSFNEVSAKAGVTEETQVISTPKIQVKKMVDKQAAHAGDIVNYTVTLVNTSTTDPALNAKATDTLSDVLDDATFNNDHKADVGAITYSEPILNWNGTVPAGGSVTIRYSAKVKAPLTGNRNLGNTVLTTGTIKSNCQEDTVAMNTDSSVAAHLLDLALGTQQAAAAQSPDCSTATATSELPKTGFDSWILIGIGLAMLAGGSIVTTQLIRRRATVRFYRR